tara:strand:+ start:467 stop:1318 length:852 start_codon:yes stop_codon:yes gene_type:complete
MQFYKYVVLLVICGLLSQPNDSLLNNIDFSQKLGRDKDPKVMDDISKFQMFSRKISWNMLNIPGMKFMTKLLFPKSTIASIKTNQKVVAFSIDDGFCGLDNPEGSMIRDVQELFKKHNSKATFFVSGSHCNYTSISEVHSLLEDGHEIANHSMYDWPYHKYSKEEFEHDLKKTKQILDQYSDDIPNWYRAPHGRLSQRMQSVLDEQGYTHVVCSVFANDTAIPDPKWISKFILKRVEPGSIILIHMPEKGVREWNYEAMEITLEGLKQQGFSVVTVSELYNLK